MEKTIKQLGEQYLSKTEHLHQDWTLVHEYPLSRELLSLSRVWKSPNGKEATKQLIEKMFSPRLWPFENLIVVGKARPSNPR